MQSALFSMLIFHQWKGNGLIVIVYYCNCYWYCSTLEWCLLCPSHIQPRAPCDFYHPYDFLPVRLGEAPIGILRRCCSRGHISLRAPYGSTLNLMVWLNNLQYSTVPRAMLARAPYGRLKSPASRLFTQTLIQTQIKENIKAPRHWPLCGEFTGTGEFPAQRDSYAENVSIW